MVIPDNWNEVISLWQKGEITAKVAQKRLGMTPATFYRRAKEDSHERSYDLRI